MKPKMLKFALIFQCCSAPKDLKMAQKKNVTERQIEFVFFFFLKGSSLPSCQSATSQMILWLNGGQTFTTGFCKANITLERSGKI